MAVDTFALLRLQYIKEYGRCRSKERIEISKRRSKISVRFNLPDACCDLHWSFLYIEDIHDLMKSLAGENPSMNASRVC